MNSFVSWLDTPFQPRRLPGPKGRRPGVITIRYRGSVGRSVVKAVIVLALFAVMSNVIGERPSQDLDANQVSAGISGEAGR